MNKKTVTPSNLDLERKIFNLQESLRVLQDSINKSLPQAEEEIQSLISKLSIDIVMLKQHIHTLDEDRTKLIHLPGISAALNSSLDTNQVLLSVIDTINNLIDAERSVLMMRDEKGELAFKLGRTREMETLSKDDLTISRSVLTQVLEQRGPVLTTNAQEDPRFVDQSSVILHNLRSILCVPLIVKDEIIGVIFSDNKSQAGKFGNMDQNLLMGIAHQAAVAIQNANLFEQLKQSNIELQIGYNNTLEGWARALELRDNETQGHTQRVTQMTIELAKYMKIEMDQLIQIRRGALLHDIGKMGIPDGILNKPGHLSLEERAVMEKHPEYARELISQIDFLKPAVDIPYSHHEHWDGTGYPLGLKGEDIPFSARIFAVVDVWDAMTTDRPYRKALAEEDVLAYIQEKSGVYFDPQVVKAFTGLRRLTSEKTDDIQP